MEKNLIEAQREHYLLGSERQWHIEAKLVRCLNRLSQNIGGLRSAASTQFSILRKALDQNIDTERMPFTWSTGTSSPAKSRNGSVSRSGLLDVINEDSEDSDGRASNGNNTWDGSSTPSRSRVSFHDIAWKVAKSGTSTPGNDLLAPADMFVMFIDQLGPPAKSLVFTLKQMLDELQFARNGTVAFDERFPTHLRSAIELYTDSRNKALELLYKSKSMSGPRPVEVLADLEEVAASCGHFSFSLLDIAEEALAYLDLLEELHAEIERTPKRRTWYWLMFWRRTNEVDEQPRSFGESDRFSLHLCESMLTERTRYLPGTDRGRPSQQHPSFNQASRLFCKHRKVHPRKTLAPSTLQSHEHLPPRRRPLRNQSRRRSRLVRPPCLPSRDATFLLPLAWRMGSHLLHGGLLHDHRRIQHHRHRANYRHHHRSLLRHRCMVHL
jgi:hypothetical protein